MNVCVSFEFERKQTPHTNIEYFPKLRPFIKSSYTATNKKKMNCHLLCVLSSFRHIWNFPIHQQLRSKHTKSLFFSLLSIVYPRTCDFRMRWGFVRALCISACTYVGDAWQDDEMWNFHRKKNHINDGDVNGIFHRCHHHHKYELRSPQSIFIKTPTEKPHHQMTSNIIIIWAWPDLLHFRCQP